MSQLRSLEVPIGNILYMVASWTWANCKARIIWANSRWDYWEIFPYLLGLDGRINPNYSHSF